MEISNKSIILSSNSPRRQQLLKDLGLKFVVKTMQTDETYPETLDPEKVAAYLAEKKANNFLPHLKGNEVLITADTIVIAGHSILNKPQDEKEAIEMLDLINGKTHLVTTGVCIADTNQKRIFSDQTQVRFSTLSKTEISHYVHHFQPFDKAGAYGIQEWIGFVGIDHIEGSYYNVMGLPVNLVYQTLKANYNLVL
ncbi:Maf family nucleotide pyrophosphatase [uncultured Cyclobacterium sp.]|uniref:Maf family nucleotide pyrophosphatase n=1 Tax=uncultured Cyclobacterium sp. TaxID=453820 RepID=UPI0030EBC117|tara:strand:+ start:26562 stop:27149 length:588 start_codon:yes stop_codon:yes gene_type:complete